MPVEIINLLSSSPEPAPARKALMKAAVPQLKQSATRTNVPPKPVQDAWYTLSSDDENGIDLPALQSNSRTHADRATESMADLRVITTTSQTTNPISTLSTRASRPNTISQRDDDFLFMSDDFDSTIDLDRSVNLPPTNSSGLSGLNRKQMEEERLARINRSKAGIVKAPPGAKKIAVNDTPHMRSSFSFNDPFEFGEGFTKRGGSLTASPSRVEASDSPADFLTKPTKRNASASLLSMSEDDPFELDIPPLKKRQLSPKLPSKTSPKRSSYKRSISNIETSLKPATTKPKTSGLARSKSTIVESDPIMFTSSPDYYAEAAKRRKEKRMPTLDEDEDIFGLGPLESSSKQNRSIRDVSCDDSSDSLPDINALVSKKPTKKPKTYAKPCSKGSDILEKYHADKAKDRKAQEKAQEKCQKSKEREQKAKNKEEEKERKRVAKEEMAKEKENAAFLAKANILKVDKKVSTPEMIVGFPSSLDPKVKDATRTFLADLSVKTYDYESELPIIKWKRRTEAVWDPEAGIFRPCELQIKEEKHIMYVMSANEFVRLATGKEGNDLDCHALQLKTRFNSREIVYLIEGLANWSRKNKTIKNRGFTEAVRNQMNPAEPNTSQRGKKKKEEPYVDEDLIEHALLKLQVVHGVLIHHSQVTENTPEWIRSFTQHISTIPYK